MHILQTSMQHLRNLFFLGPQTCFAGACFCAITLGKTVVSSMLFRYVSLFLRFSSLFELELGPWRHHRAVEIWTKIDVCTAPAPTKAEPPVQPLTYAQPLYRCCCCCYNFVLWNGTSYAPLLSTSKPLVKADLRQFKAHV